MRVYLKWRPSKLKKKTRWKSSYSLPHAVATSTTVLKKIRYCFGAKRPQLIFHTSSKEALGGKFKLLKFVGFKKALGYCFLLDSSWQLVFNFVVWKKRSMLFWDCSLFLMLLFYFVTWDPILILKQGSMILCLLC